MMIPGVSVCSVGEAKGHNLKVDETLLIQLANEIQRKGKVAVGLGHRSGLSGVVGWLQNARIQAGKLVADLGLLPSGNNFEFVRELIAHFRNNIGLSPAFTGSPEPLPDGSVAARCKELHSVDLVAEPAANPTGLFSATYNDRITHFAACRFGWKRRRQPLRSCSAAVRLTELANDLPTVQFGRLRYRDDEEQEHTDGTSIGHDVAAGAIEGAGAAVLTDALLHGEGTVAERLGGIGRQIKAPISSGLPKKLLIGGVSGGLLTAGAGLIVSKIANDRRKKREARGSVATIPAQTQLARLTPEEERQRALYRVSAAKHRISDDELNRAAGSYTKAGATGAVAGALIGSLGSKTKIGAGLGALAGIGSIKVIRTASPPDPFGQTSPGERAIEKSVPITAGIVAAIAARKKLKQITSRAAESVGRNLARSGRLFD